MKNNILRPLNYRTIKSYTKLSYSNYNNWGIKIMHIKHRITIAIIDSSYNNNKEINNKYYQLIFKIIIKIK